MKYRGDGYDTCKEEIHLGVGNFFVQIESFEEALLPALVRCNWTLEK